MKALFFSTGLCFFGIQTFGQQLSSDTANRTFTLGEVVINQKQDKNNISAVQIENFAKNDVSHALALLPGVTMSAVGPRNEAMVYVRGFDLRQVPVLIDGVPVYVPYDGYVDLARFTTFDLSAIQVSKGYTSVNYGPNALGGAINLITRKPVKPFEFNGATGFISGGFRSNLNIGARLDRFYVQAGVSKLKRDNYPLSSNFTPVPNEDGGRRDNSYSNDEKYHIKVAFTPNARSEYAIAYTYQHGDKGSPLYAGSDTKNSLLTKPRYWQWPKWDKQSLYFLSNTTIDSTQSIKTRLYYDVFKNQLDSWDDAKYNTMTRPYAFSSIYNDYTLGAIVQYDKSICRRDNISASVQYKKDVHREYNVGEPQRTMSDGTFTVAAENQFNITSTLQLLTGVSYNHRNSITAQDYNSNTKTIGDYPSNSNDALNVQGGLVYKLASQQQLNFSVARKTRFATTKDRYSYRLGTAIPNPDLQAEYSLNYELGYSGTFDRLTLQGSLFLSNVHNTILSVNNVKYDSTAKIWLSQLQNTGESRYQGVEVAADYQVLNGLTAGVNYTYIHRRNITNPTLYLTDVPRHKLFVYGQYQLKDIFRVQANMEYNSGRYSTTYGVGTSPYTVFNISAAVKVWKCFSVEAGVNNIFDKNYFLVEGYPEAGRVYFGNVVYKF